MRYLEVPSLMDGSISPRSSMSSESVYSDSMSRSDGEDSPPVTKKKRVRANLTNMSSEDKINRRKLKNRVAAQAARDRKKTKMDSMEETLAKFSEERLKLVKENERLKRQNEELVKENARLQERLAGKVTDDAMTVSSSSLNKKLISNPKTSSFSDNPFESAALIHDSLPQNQGKSLERMSLGSETVTLKRKRKPQTSSPVSMMPFVYLLMSIANQKKSWTGLKSVQPNSCQPPLLPKKETSHPVSLLIPRSSTQLRRQSWSRSET